jgi:anthranilate phosphoribosyltransferase
MFAPLMHPALRHVGPVRRELAIPTVMNMVGPLANPARAGRQVVGVAERGRLELLAEALAKLGSRHAMVVHGAPGLDEVSPLGETTVVEVRDGVITHWSIDPSIAGVEGIDVADLAGGEPRDNAGLIELVLDGSGPPAARAAVMLNAAAALYVGGRAPDYAAAVGLAREGLRSGVGALALNRLRAASHAATELAE